MNGTDDRPTRLLPTLAALLLLLAAGAGAQAQPMIDRGYVDLQAGVSFPGKVSATLSGAADARGDLAARPGALVGGAIGYRAAPDWRVEAEVAYR